MFQFLEDLRGVFLLNNYLVMWKDHFSFQIYRKG